jgi:hypothetical protein
MFEKHNLPSPGRNARMAQPRSPRGLVQHIARRKLQKTTIPANGVVIGSVFLMHRFASPGRNPNDVKVGDQLPGLTAYNWKAHDRTLVLALRSGCHFCETSMPFYRKLAQLEQSNQIGVHLIAVFPDDPAAVRQVVEAQQLTIEVVPGFELGQVKVQATPTLMLVDEQGRGTTVIGRKGMWILRLVRNFALLAVLALAARAAAGADARSNPHCGGPCGGFPTLSCPKGCHCIAISPLASVCGHRG